MTYQMREKLVYSKIGKFVATIYRNHFYPNARVHWLQQAFADTGSFCLNLKRNP